MFKCQYCGNVPPECVLEVDHIHPVYKGGKNNIDNLITSCFECNRGKGRNELSSLPNSTAQKAEILKLKLKQYKEFQKLQMELESAFMNDALYVDKIFTSYFDGYCLSEKFINVSLKKFIDSIGVNQCASAMHKACARHSNSEYAIKYFCGICWNTIKRR